MTIRIFLSAGALSMMLGALYCAPATAQEAAPAAPAETQDWALHAQATFVTQGVFGFASPYQGPNSLAPRQVKETFDATLYAGVRPWRGGELWINPEVDQGFGLSNTLGAAGFPSAEAYKVGKSNPYVRLQRLFFRQTIDLGGEAQAVVGAANQLAGTQTANRLVLTVGKLGVGDVFDTNRYAHDPRGDFLNWSVVDAGSFDYAADAWGYSYGVAVEWYQGPWTLRLGAFNLSKIPNGETLERDFRQYQLVGEIEHRHTIAGHPGAVRVTVFRNRGNFSRFDDAVALAAATGGSVDPSLTRRRMSRPGGDINIEQEVTDNLGLFARAGITDGAIEPYDFTDIDRTVEIGGALKGKSWGRADDTVGFAAVVNGISKAHERYLNAGGIGVLVGDGKLPHPGAEMIAEAFYDWQAVRGINNVRLSVHRPPCLQPRPRPRQCAGAAATRGLLRWLVDGPPAPGRVVGGDAARRPLAARRPCRARDGQTVAVERLAMAGADIRRLAAVIAAVSSRLPLLALLARQMAMTAPTGQSGETNS